jgi:hypothetical protein
LAFLLVRVLDFHNRGLQKTADEFDLVGEILDVVGFGHDNVILWNVEWLR